MIESKGKTAARKYLYQHILPGCFSPEKLRTGKLLLLLGKGKELAYTDGLGIKRQHIISIERNPLTYQRQKQNNTGVTLHCEEVVNFLKKLPRKNEDFLFIHLDVEGTYLNQIDPALSSALLYAVKNPKTLFASCSTVGRDTEVIWEGLKSLAVFLWLAKEETLDFVKKMSTFYRLAQYKNPLRMAIRDLFWLRSHLERSLILFNTAAVSQKFFDAEKALWLSIMDARAMKIKDILIITEKLQQHLTGTASVKLFLEINFIGHLLYRSTPPWNQSVYLTRYALLPDPIDCLGWIRVMMKKFSTLPLIYFRRSGKMKIISDSMYEQSIKALSKKPIWKKRDIFSYSPRELKISELKIPKTLVKKTTARIKKEVLKVTAIKSLVYRNGKLTEIGKTRVRDLAGKGMNIPEIYETLNLSENVNTFNGVRSFIAGAKRKKSCINLALTAREKLVFAIIPECAEKTAQGPRIRRLYPQVGELLKKRQEYASPSVICGLVKKLIGCGVLTKVAKNQLQNEKRRALVYSFNQDLYKQVRVAKIKKTVSVKKKNVKNIVKEKKTILSTKLKQVPSDFRSETRIKLAELDKELEKIEREKQHIINKKKKVEKILADAEEKIRDILK